MAYCKGYEQQEEGSLKDLFRARRIMLIYIFITCVSGMVYAQFKYLLPIQMDEMFPKLVVWQAFYQRTDREKFPLLYEKKE